MGTATILGDTYQTVIMPDGKEWMKTALNWGGSGSSWGSAEQDAALCRHYNWYEARQLVLTDGWHLPSDPDFIALIMAVGGYNVAGYNLKDTSYWTDDNVATNLYGFSWRPSRFISPNSYGYYWQYDSINSTTSGAYFPQNDRAAIYYTTLSKSADFVAVRLVRDPPR